MRGSGRPAGRTESQAPGTRGLTFNFSRRRAAEIRESPGPEAGRRKSSTGYPVIDFWNRRRFARPRDAGKGTESQAPGTRCLTFSPDRRRPAEFRKELNRNRGGESQTPGTR